MNTAENEWQRWGGKANSLMGYREEVMRADAAVDCACRNTPNFASVNVTEAIRHLRKAVKELEMLRYRIEKDRT